MSLEKDYNQEEENQNSQNPKIPNDQWNLPIGFMPNGLPITLNNYIDVGSYHITEKFDNRDFNQEEIKQLVLERLRSVNNYGTFSFNKEIVNRDLAIKEVEKGSELGDL